MGECVFVCVCVCVRRLFWYNFEDSIHQSHVITHLFLNANSLYNCWFYTHVACFVEHNTWYQNCTKIKGHLLSKYLLHYAHCELFTEGSGFWDGHYIYIQYIWKSEAVYTGYVVTEYGVNMNMGQYYNWQKYIQKVKYKTMCNIKVTIPYM